MKDLLQAFGAWLVEQLLALYMRVHGEPFVFDAPPARTTLEQFQCRARRFNSWNPD